MTIQLKPEQENFIKAQVATGKYNSPQEVVDKMFLVFEKVQDDYEQWLQETRLKIDEGIESLERGVNF
jgi:antitoxin ParD1/3/4